MCIFDENTWNKIIEENEFMLYNIFILIWQIKILLRIGDIMFQNRITLTPKDILNKEFKVDVRGFNLKEVDQFLDVIIGDYEEFYKIIKENEREKEKLLDEITNLKQEVRNLKTNIEIAKSGSTERKEVTNVDIMRRLSQLEKIVYGKEEEEETDNQ